MRRITEYVREEARKWLAEQIINNDTNHYYSCNKCKDGRNLILDIQRDRIVTQHWYEIFIELFNNNPFDIITASKKDRMNKITTDSVLHYFYEYNGYLLPVGFIIDFFEDDFETQDEKDNFIKEVLDDKKLSFLNAIKRPFNKQSDAVDKDAPELKEYDGILRPKVPFYITNFLYCCLAIAMTVLFCRFVKELRIFEVIGSLISDYHFNVQAMDASTFWQVFGSTDAFLLNTTYFKNTADYFSKYSFQIVVAVCFLLILIPKISRTLRILIYRIKSLICNCRIGVVANGCRKFERREAFNIISDYFDSIMPQLVDTERRIDASDFRDIPREVKDYNRIMKINVDSILDKLAGIMSKYKSKKLAYELTTYTECRKSWVTKLVFSIIFFIIFMVLVNSDLYKLVLSKIQELLSF